MNLDPIFLLIFIPHVLFSISVHESAHAAAAYYLGDDTAARLGRISLNPLRHLDLFGILAFLIIHLGWAKPVPVNPARLRNPRRDDVLVSLAGPLSTMVVAVVILLVARIYLLAIGPQANDTVFRFFLVGAQLNLALAFFNLIPVPPLDGSHVLEAFLPDKLSRGYQAISQYGILVLVGLIILGDALHFPLLDIIIFKPAWAIISLLLKGSLPNSGL